MASRLSPVARLLVAFGLAAISASAQSGGARWIDVEFPRDSPVVFISFNLGKTAARVQGMSMALDLHPSLLLRNAGTKPICGLTLRVEAQDLTPAGKGSVTIPSLNIQPGEVFPVRVDLQLLRPFNGTANDASLVQVSLDCVLFRDLSAYGQDRLGSRRTLTVYELEARRDRRYLGDLLQAGRLSQLREELNFGLPDWNPPQLAFELMREHRSAKPSEQNVRVGLMSFKGSPVAPVEGAARLNGNEVWESRVEVRNRSQKTVESLALGWILRDDHGRNYVAGSMPSKTQLAPVQTAPVVEGGTLRFSRPNSAPFSIGAVSAFVDNVQFTDGRWWIMSRADIEEATDDPILRRALAASPEQQRLAEVYRKKGINALAEELKRMN